MELPYIRIRKMNELIKEIPLDFVTCGTEFGTKDLSKLLQISKSSASNFIISLKALNLIEGKKKLKFTKIGEQYVKLLIRGQNGEAKKLLQNQIKNLEYFQIILQRLKIKGKLTIEEIGNILALSYDKTWKDTATTKNYGAAVASIIDFVGFGVYRNGILIAMNKENEESEKIEFVAPDVNVNKIFTILKALYPSGSDVRTLSRKLKTKEGRLSVELGCCILLGLVKRSARGYYKITEFGERIICPLATENERKRKFRSALLQSPYRVILERLLEKNKIEGLTVKEIGELLEFEFRKKWNEKTKQSYARKFIGWLEFSELLSREGNNYRLKVNLLKEELSKNNNVLQEEKSNRGLPKVDAIKYYFLGKGVGQLIGKANNKANNNKVDIEKIIGTILAFCRESGLEEVAEDWRADYQLFRDIKDYRIFLRDIKALEKVLGVMEK